MLYDGGGGRTAHRGRAGAGNILKQYDVAKAAIDRLGFALAKKLRLSGLVALTIHPGFTRTERVEAVAPPEDLKQTHSPCFVGRAVVALATDPNVMRHRGGVFKAGQLGLDYGFTDINGSQPEPFVIPDAYGTKEAWECMCVRG